MNTELKLENELWDLSLDTQATFASQTENARRKDKWVILGMEGCEVSLPRWSLEFFQSSLLQMSSETQPRATHLPSPSMPGMVSATSRRKQYPENSISFCQILSLFPDDSFADASVDGNEPYQHERQGKSTESNPSTAPEWKVWLSSAQLPSWVANKCIGQRVARCGNNFLFSFCEAVNL